MSDENMPCQVLVQTQYAAYITVGQVFAGGTASIEHSPYLDISAFNADSCH